MTMVLDGSNGLTFPNSSTQAVGFYGFKNRIINGGMTVSQYNGSSSVTVTNAYVIDRFAIRCDTGSSNTAGQSTTAPTGFINSLVFTTGTGASPGSSAQNRIYQGIEGLNVTDLAWGTANAKTVTLSFWVRSSLTGQFGGVLNNSAFNRSYPFTYTISSANTWTQISITIPGDTSGTWLTTNGVGIGVFFDLGMGSTFVPSSSSGNNTWNGSDYRGAYGDTAVVGTSSATFYITGVQLEVGSTATSFDYRPYGTELQLCQRYFETSYYPTAAVPTNSTGGAVVMGVGSTTYYGTSSALTSQSLSFFSFKVNKRAAPTTTIYSYASSTTATVSDGWTGVDKSSNSGSINNSSFQGFSIYNGSGSNITVASYAVEFHYASTAEL